MGLGPTQGPGSGKLAEKWEVYGPGGPHGSGQRAAGFMFESFKVSTTRLVYIWEPWQQACPAVLVMAPCRPTRWRRS